MVSNAPLPGIKTKHATVRWPCPFLSETTTIPEAPPGGLPLKDASARAPAWEIIFLGLYLVLLGGKTNQLIKERNEYRALCQQRGTD